MSNALVSRKTCWSCEKPAPYTRENSKMFARFPIDGGLPDPATAVTTHDSLPWCGGDACLDMIEKSLLVIEPPRFG